MAQSVALPVLFVVDHDPNSLDVLLSGLSGRFGNDFAVRGETSPEAALATLREMAAANEPVALLLVDDAASEFLAPAHELHPRAKRVLLVDRDYSSTSPAVQAMALGRSFADDGLTHRLTVGDAIDVEVEDLTPPGSSEPTRFENIAHPAASSVTVARATSSRVSGFGIEFEGTAGSSAPFAWSG